MTNRIQCIEKDRVFYELSGGGMTVLGGKCMLQADALCELLRKAHEKQIKTAADTAGNVDWKVFDC